MSEPRPWEVLGREEGPDLFICRVRYDQLRNPRTDQVLRRVVLETPDWVNVVALTPERSVVLVRQYRFGISALTSEIPGGVIDRGEDSREAAERELREETGFTSPRWTYLGAVESNPAFLSNRCHHWLAEDAVRTHEQAMDPGEDIAVRVYSESELLSAIRTGEIAHSLALTALARVFDLRRISG